MMKFFSLLVFFSLMLTACFHSPVVKIPKTPPITPKVSPTQIPKPATTIPPVQAPAKQPVQESTKKKLEVQNISLISGNLFFKPETLVLKVNQPVTIAFQNTGGHTFTIDELGVNVDLNNASGIITFTPAKIGTFEYYCAIPGHKQAGMKGSVKVE